MTVRSVGSVKTSIAKSIANVTFTLTRLFLECTSCFYERIISDSCASFQIFCLLFSVAAEAYDLNAAHCSEWQRQNILLNNDILQIIYGY